jgi:hypothetical protein
LLRRGVPLFVTVAVIAAVSVGTYFGYVFLTTSERFAIANVEIYGEKHVSEQTVMERLGDPLGTNIFSIATSDMERELESEPWIVDADVRRRLPNKLIVRVAEYEAVALADLGRLYLIDAEGTPFKRAEIGEGDGEGLKVISGLPRDLYLEQPETARRTLAEALELMDIYDRKLGRPAIAELHIDAWRGYTLVTHESATLIRLGHGPIDRLRGRLHAFDAAWGALTEIERSDARTVFADNQTHTDRVTVSF